MMKSVYETILLITCALVMLGFAPNTQAGESDDGLVTPAAMVATASSSLAASRGKIAPSAMTFSANSLAERVVLSAAPSRIMSRSYLGTPDHRLNLSCALRC